MNTSITTPLLQPAGSAAPSPVGETAQAEKGEGFSQVFSRELPSQGDTPRQAGAEESPDQAQAETAGKQASTRPPAQAADPADVENAEKKPEAAAGGKQAAATGYPMVLLSEPTPGQATRTATPIAGKSEEESEEPQPGSPVLALSTVPPGGDTSSPAVKPTASNPSLSYGLPQTPAAAPALLSEDGGPPGHSALNETPATAESGKPLPIDGKDAPPRLSSVLDFLNASTAMKLNTASAGEGSGATAGAAESTALPSLSALAEALGDPGGALANRAFSPPSSSADLLRSLGQAGTPPQFPLHAQAGGGEWQAELGQRIRWLAGLKISSAELHLHPAELGAMEVRILSEDDRTTVSFSSNNPAARELIEASLPRLRELLAGSGLQLSHSEVSQQGGRHEHGAFARALRQNGTSATAATDLIPEAPPARAAAGLNLVDHYV